MGTNSKDKSDITKRLEIVRRFPAFLLNILKVNRCKKNTNELFHSHRLIQPAS